MAQFFWVRTYDQYNGWQTFYEGYEEPLARDFYGRVQAGAYVIADIFSVDQNHWLPRETWQTYSPHTEPGKPRDIESAPVEAPLQTSSLDPKCRPPTKTDPALAKKSMEWLRKFIASGASYGAVSYETLAGNRYAFRYAEHPPDAGVSVPHPGVDYLECGKADSMGETTDWGMVAATGAVVVGVPLAIWWGMHQVGR